MTCPTCDHTLSQINREPDIFWCERCGTATNVYADGSPCVPKLVERCRQFEARIPMIEGVLLGLSDWISLGIAESIHPPGRRPNDASV